MKDAPGTAPGVFPPGTRGVGKCRAATYNSTIKTREATSCRLQD